MNDEDPNVSLEPTPEQVRYAGILEKGMYAGLGCLFVTFALYVFGVMEPHVPLAKLSEYWTKSVDAYLAEGEIPAGWGWVSMLGHGDFVNFIGVVILAGVTIFCYLSIVPVLLKSKDKIYLVLVLLEIAVLVIAASGVITVGH